MKLPKKHLNGVKRRTGGVLDIVILRPGGEETTHPVSAAIRISPRGVEEQVGLMPLS